MALDEKLIKEKIINKGVEIYGRILNNGLKERPSLAKPTMIPFITSQSLGFGANYAYLLKFKLSNDKKRYNFIESLELKENFYEKKLRKFCGKNYQKLKNFLDSAKEVNLF